MHMFSLIQHARLSVESYVPLTQGAAMPRQGFTTPAWPRPAKTACSNACILADFAETFSAGFQLSSAYTESRSLHLAERGDSDLLESSRDSRHFDKPSGTVSTTEVLLCHTYPRLVKDLHHNKHIHTEYAWHVAVTFSCNQDTILLTLTNYGCLQPTHWLD